MNCSSQANDRHRRASPARHGAVAYPAVEVRAAIISLAAKGLPWAATDWRQMWWGGFEEGRSSDEPHMPQEAAARGRAASI